MEYNKCLFVLLTAVLALVATSSAKTETIAAEAYNVSFDLNTTEQYSIGDVKREYSESYEGINHVSYIIPINGSNLASRASISIDFYNQTMNKDIESNMRRLEESLGYFCDKVNVCPRKIDGQSGILGTGIRCGSENEFYAKYWLLSNESTDTCVKISSRYPWNDGTLSLLRTIHVEIVGKPPSLL